jgi:serine/threonine protein kinase
VDTGSRRVKLLDFGLAQLRTLEAGATASVSIAGVVVGTLGYMAPEQFAGVRVDERADIFAFGVMLAEALTGRRPFRRPTFAAAVSSMPLDEFHLPGEGPAVRALDALLQRCLATEPASRFASAADVQRQLIPALRVSPLNSISGEDTSRSSLQDVDLPQQPVDEVPTRER